MAKKDEKKFRANQYQVDPRQADFLAYFLNPESETFSNALQSGLKAGYSQEYSENITNQLPKWLAENLGKHTRLAKAEKVLDKTLEYNTEEEGKVNTQLLKIQSDVAKFIAETVGKATYSKRQEFTGKDGEKLVVEISREIAEKHNVPASSTSGDSKGHA